RDALPDRLAVEGAAGFPFRDIGLALVEHLHVTAERDRGDHVLVAVAAAAQPQRLAEADREAQHAHAASARDPVVAELVEGHQHADADDHPPDRTEEAAHACARAMRSLAWARARASASSSVSSESAGA